MPSYWANRDPTLTEDELARVNKILLWARMHKDCMFFGVLVTVPRLTKFVYAKAGDGSRSKPAEESTKVLVDLSRPTVNTWGATP